MRLEDQVMATGDVWRTWQVPEGHSEFRAPQGVRTQDGWKLKGRLRPKQSLALVQDSVYCMDQSRMVIA